MSMVVQRSFCRTQATFVFDSFVLLPIFAAACTFYWNSLAKTRYYLLSLWSSIL